MSAIIAGKGIGLRMVNTCKTCGAKIVWMKTVAGKNMPVNWIPGIENIAIFNHKTMTSHFSDCPQAKEHRKGG